MGNGQDHDDATVVGDTGWPSAPPFLLRFDSGFELTVTGRTFVGRSPEPRPAHLGGAVAAIDDPTMMMSKTHALFDVVDGALRVSDVGSTNGTSVVDAHGEATVPVGTWRELHVGDRICLGGRWAEVLALTGASPSPTTHSPSAMPPPPPPPPPAAPGGTPASLAPPPVPAPPLPTSAVSASPAQPVAPATGRTPRVPSASWIALAAVAVVVVGAAAWFIVLRDDDDGTSSTGAPVPALASDPTLRFTAELDTSDPDDVEVTGSPSSVYVLAHDEDTDQTTITALDDDGAVRWDVSFEGEFDDHQVVDGELVVAIEAEDGSTLHRLAEGEADAVWSLDIGDNYWIAGPEGVYVVDRDLWFRDGSGEIELHDAATGESLGRARLADGSVPSFDYSYVGALLSWDRDDDEIQVLSTRFEELTQRIDVGDADAAAYRDGVLLTGAGDELTAYDSDGERTLRASSVDEINIIAPLGDGRWLVQGSSELEVVHVTDGGVESVWRQSGQSGNLFTVDGRHYVVMYDDDAVSVLDAGTGDAVLELGEGSIDPAANGVLLRDTGTFEAYELPSGDLLFSTETADEDDFHLLDGGYAVIVRDGDNVAIEVHS